MRDAAARECHVGSSTSALGMLVLRRIYLVMGVFMLLCATFKQYATCLNSEKFVGGHMCYISSVYRCVCVCLCVQLKVDASLAQASEKGAGFTKLVRPVRFQPR